VSDLSRVSVGVVEGRRAIDVDLAGAFVDERGRSVPAGRHALTSPVSLTPADPASSFAIEDVTIGIGFHWERNERQVFRGGLRVIARRDGLSAINDVPLEEYVTSVISSEMSASCPPELLKAHAVISRSWLKSPGAGGGGPRDVSGPGEIRRWYGREAHPDFDVCADDHCQRYQGITKAFSTAASEAARATAGEFLVFGGVICDARFSKACGGIVEVFRTAWEDVDVPYLAALRDEDDERLPDRVDAREWIRGAPPAFCDTRDPDLLARILPGFDQETAEFYRWRVALTGAEIGELVRSKLDVDLGDVTALEPLARGPSTRIHRLRIGGTRGDLVVGKELEIRRALSPTHLLSSAFVVDRDGDRFVLTGAGWGHGVGLCQIGAAVMADRGRTYREILAHYYPGAEVAVPLGGR
jgi:SpoIID/LytB domain protein